MSDHSTPHPPSAPDPPDPPAADPWAPFDGFTWELGPDPDDARWAAEHLSEGFDTETPADVFPAEPEPPADTPDAETPEPDWDAMAREAWATHCLERGVEPFDPYLVADTPARGETSAYGRTP